MQVIGLDVGTSGVKSTVFDEGARVLAHAYREYGLIGGERGEYELDTALLLESAMAVLGESARGMADVRAICVTSFGESFVCLDERGNPLANTMIYMDKRGAEECVEYEQTHTCADVFARSGQFIDPMFAMYKLRWMQKHRPEVMRKTREICFIADFITRKLGARHACDYSLASRSGMFDVHEKRWIADAVAFSGLNEAQLPEPVPGGSVVGALSALVAERLNMNAGALLIVGGHDQILAALGSGARAAGDVMNGMGTTDSINCLMAGDKLDPEKMLAYNFPMVPYLDTGLFATYAWNMSGGCIVRWFRDTLAKDVAGRPDAYDVLGAEAPGEPTGILVLPYLAGGGTPYMDARTPGVVHGLTLNTTRGKLFRAFLEGESCEAMLNIECLQDAGIDVGDVVTVGGGARSDLWMQIRADMFGRTVHLPKISEAGTLASALLCYAALGLYPDVWAAQRALIGYARSFTPNPINTEIYAAHYKRYKALYAAMRAL